MQAMKRAWIWLLWLAVALAPWLAGLSHPFVYDDIGMIADNRFLEDPSRLGRVLTGRTLMDSRVVNGRRPAVLATYFFDRAWHGLKPAGWRWTSLLLHLGCAALLAGLLRRLGGGDWIARASALLFALHPALVEAVHAPGFRADVLCLFFMLLALHGFLSLRGGRGWGGLAGGMCTAGALLSKETALALPLLLGLLMGLFPKHFPERRAPRAAILALCGGIAAAFFAAWVAFPAGLQALDGSWNGISLRFPETIFSMPALWTRTLRLLLVPWPLNVTPFFEPVTSALSWRFWGGGVVLAVCVAMAWRLRKSSPWITLGLAWVGAMFLPVSNLWPLLHPVADRYAYPMAPGWAMVLAAGLNHGTRRFRRLGLAGLVSIFALLLTVRIAEWSSSETLWTTALARNPKSATAATWLGLLREEAGDAEAARGFYRRAVEANPHAVSAWINGGILEGKAGKWEESERWLRRAVAVQPEGARGWHNLAVCLEQQGRRDEASVAAARAKALRSDYGSVKP